MNVPDTCFDCQQIVDDCLCYNRVAQKTLTQSVICEGCNKRESVCMCRTTVPVDFEEVILKRNVTRETDKTMLAARLRETAKANLEKRTRQGADNMVGAIKLLATKAAENGCFSIQYSFNPKDFSWASAILAAKLLTEEGFVCEVIDGSSMYNTSSSNYISVNWSA